LNKAKELFLLRDEIYTRLADYTIENRDIDNSVESILKVIK
jgi:shikimate kinase